MSGFLSLPDELLSAVLRLLRGSCTLNEAWQVLPTCRKLYGLGKVMLMEHVKITDSTAMPFIWSCKAAPSTFVSIRSLSIELHLDWSHLTTAVVGDRIDEIFDNRERWHAWAADENAPCSRVCRAHIGTDTNIAGQTKEILKAISSTIATTTRHLMSFSLIIHAEPADKSWCRCLEPFFSSNLIARIVNVLPDTCTSLFIDIGAAFIKYAEKSLVEALLKKRSMIENLHIRMVYGIEKLFLLDTGVLQHWKSPDWLAFDNGRYLLDEDVPVGDWMPDDLWDGSDFAFSKYQCWKRSTAYSTRSNPIHDEETDDLRLSSSDSIIPWPRLKSLTLSDSPFPILRSEIGEGDLSAFARIMVENITKFPQLRKAIIVQTQLDQISGDELDLVTSDPFRTDESHQPDYPHYESRVHPGVHPDPHWCPMSTFVVWDVINRNTHLLPIQPCKPEPEFPRLSFGSAPYYVLHDPYNNVHHGSHRQLMRIVDESFGLSWMSSAADGVLLPVHMAKELGLQPTTGISLRGMIRALDDSNYYDISLYLRALTFRAFTETGLNDRLEMYWVRHVRGEEHQVVSRKSLWEIAAHYNIASNDQVGLRIHPWVCQWLEDGDDIKKAHGKYVLSEDCPSDA